MFKAVCVQINMKINDFVGSIFREMLGMAGKPMFEPTFRVCVAAFIMHESRPINKNISQHC